MLIYVGIALLITMTFGYVYETIKMYKTQFEIKRINLEIVKLLNEAKIKEDIVDVFLVENLRELFKDKLLKNHQVDDFKLYKKDNRNIQMSYKWKMAVQNLELHIEPMGRALRIGNMDYCENPFEEIHL
jgi:hypothetical protein